MPHDWLPLSVIGLAAVYLGLSTLLRRVTTPELSAPPRHVGHIVAPLALLLATGIPSLLRGISPDMLMPTLWGVVGFYALALGLERQPRWATHLGLLAPITLLATLHAFGLNNQAGMIVTLASIWLLYLPFARVLDGRGWANLAATLRRTAHYGIPGLLGLIAITALPVTGLISLSLIETLWHIETIAPTLAVLATALCAGTAFYLCAALLERKSYWSSVSTLLSVLAVLTTTWASSAATPTWGLVISLAALAYLILGICIERILDGDDFAVAAYATTVPLTIAALIIGFRGDLAVWAFPALIAVGVLTIWAAYTGLLRRIGGLDAPARVTLANVGIVLAAGLLPFVLQNILLRMPEWSQGGRGLVFLVLGLLYALAAWFGLRRLRPVHDHVLSVIAVVSALAGAWFAIGERATATPGMAFLAALWVFQALARKQRIWATLALGNAFGVAVVAIASYAISPAQNWWIGACLLFTLVYTVGATLLQLRPELTWGNTWRIPALGWGVAIGFFTLGAVYFGARVDGVQPLHAGTLLALALLCGCMAWPWRKPLLGYPATLLVTLAYGLALTHGFFVRWALDLQQYGLAICGLAVLIGLLGYTLRRVIAERVYSLPYSAAALGLTLLAPLCAIGNAQYLALTWGLVTLIYSAATVLYKRPWMVAPAMVAFDLTLLHGAGWVLPGGRVANSALLLLVAAWLQGLVGLFASYRERRMEVPAPIPALYSVPAYLVTGISGLGAILLALGATDVWTTVTLGLALLLGLISTRERFEPGAWGALVLFGVAMSGIGSLLHISAEQGYVLGMLGTLAIYATGWVLERWSGVQPLRLAIWKRPLTLGPLAISIVLLGLTALTFSLQSLVYGLAIEGVFLLTLATRQRKTLPLYAGSGLIVAAFLCQFSTWGMASVQWYAIPVGLYLLGLAEGLRHFEKRPQAARIIEGCAALLLLGVTFGQALQAHGFEKMTMTILLCVESVILLFYGTLRQLRIPFFGGAIFFVAGVIWLAFEPLTNANIWFVVGGIGVLMIATYVILERYREWLVSTGKQWAERIGAWS